MSNSNLTITLTKLPVTKEVIEDYAEFIDWDEITWEHATLIPTHILRDHCSESKKNELALSAAISGKYNVLVNLIEAGVDPNIRGLFTNALKSKKSKIIRFLIKKGVDVSQLSKSTTQYVMLNSSSIVSVLLKKGFTTENVYYHAICEDNWKSINILIDLGIDINQNNSDSALSMMCKKDPEYHNLNVDFYDAFNKIIMHFPLKVHERSMSYGMHTPLMHAVEYNNTKLTQILVDANSDIYMYNKDHQTVYELASRLGNKGEACRDILKKRHKELQKNSKIKKELK